MNIRVLSIAAVCALTWSAGLAAQSGRREPEPSIVLCRSCQQFHGCTAHGAQKKIDLSNLVASGDSLTAGYQNSQLLFSSQVHGYANVIATQAGVDLNLPLLPSPGFPQIMIEGGFAVVTGVDPVARENNLPTRNVAVPGYTVAALVGYQAACSPDPANPLYAIQFMAAEILNPNCLDPAPTQLQEAASLLPTSSILWIGSNDALAPILFGGDPTDWATFGHLHGIAASTLAQASGKLVLANVPDVTTIPYLTSVEKLAGILKLPLQTVMVGLGLGFGDKVSPYAFALIEAMGTSLQPLPETTSDGAPVVLRAAKLWQARRAVAQYNALIAEGATANDALLVDVNLLFRELAEHGVVVNGQRLTTDFMGGLFSLDGIHPTNTGYAIIANEFIKAMNRCTAAGVPPVSVEQVAKTDPLVFPDSHPGKMTGHVSQQMADALRGVRPN